MPASRKYQQGAVAILVGFTLVLLVGMLALVVDLGHLYLAKTGLQNAADAAALSGAKSLNGTTGGVNSAVTNAINTAGMNTYFHDFGQEAVEITADNIRFSDDAYTTPDSAWMTVAQAQSAPVGLAFIKVDTGPQSLRTWFAPVLRLIPGADFSELKTFGMAVAGMYLTDITPIAVCRLADDPASTFDDELGFERGVSYRIGDFNPIGPGTIYWIDPVSKTPGVCDTTSTSATLPYVCSGKVGFTPVVGETVNTNTGLSDPQLSALDSRFGDYPPSSGCVPATAQPDSNVKEYRYNYAAGTGSPADWMLTNPNRQSVHPVDTVTGGVCKQSSTCKPEPRALRGIQDYGVLWSRYRTQDKTVSNWSDTNMYKEAAALYPPPLDSYPGSSPYAQTATSTAPYNNYFEPPPVAYGIGKSGRRVLNMVIVECQTSGGLCRPATVLGVGKFFMQRRANVSGDKDIYAEFGGLLPDPLPTPEIRLYR